MYRLTLKNLVRSVVVSILLIALSTKIQAQSDPTSSPTPNFAPKSPEAAAFLKYGEYPVDLSTGVPGISIPLYTVDIKDFKLPISLDYHASGIKVNQEATWVGLGWNLNAGAQVVLSPRDEIDENNPYIDQIPDGDAIIAYFKLHPYKQNAIRTLDPNLDKSRVKDMYVFSSPTVNGSFYIRNFASNDVVIIPPNAFNVSLIGADRADMKFKITDPQGNVYTLNTTEVSIQSMTHSDRYISAWYVDEIKTPSNNIINFTYQDDGNLTDRSFSQRVEIKKIISKAECPGEGSESNQIGAVIDQVGSTVTLLKKIKDIIFNNGNSKVSFTKYIGRQDLVDGAGNGYLNKIEIQNFDNIKGYTFEYSYFNASGSNYSDKRLRLDKIVNLFGRVEQEFVYSSVSPPNKTSKGMDYFGYYNGAVANQDLIPKHYISYPYSTEVGHGNRSVSTSFNQAGILKEIHYPTKGWTKFNYETNEFYGVDNFSKYVPVIISSNIIQGTGGTVPVKEGPSPHDGIMCLNTNPLDCVNYVSIPFTAINANGLLTFKLDKPEGDNPTLLKYHYARVRVISGGAIVYDSGRLVGQQYDINVPLPGSGTIEVEVYGQYYSVKNLQLKYSNIDVSPKNNLGAGLRISTIENYDSDNSLVLKKQYDYSDITNVNNSSGQLINNMTTTFESNFFTNYEFIQCAPPEPELIGCFPGINSQRVYSISSNSRFGIEGNSVAYKYVKEKQIDPKNLINNGFTQYEFTIWADEIPFGNPTVQIPTTWKRGKVLNKKTYKTIGATNYIVEEEKNTYFEDASNTSLYNGFKMFRMGTTNTQENPSDPLEPMCPYFAGGGVTVLQTIEPITYNIPILWFYQKTSEKSNYFYNTSNTLTGTLSSKTTYNYNNPSHLQLSSQTTTNSTGETLETKYFYAQDLEMAAKPFIADLKAANIIVPPLNTQTFKAGAKIAEQLTNYDKSSATSNLLLPRTVYANKGAGAIDLNLDKKLTYDLYDDKGNVLQYTPDSGIPVSIIWGYNKTQPIAKVENVVFAAIPPATVTNLQGLSNADSDNCLTPDCTEELLRVGLNDFRSSLPGAFISVYTYNPLVGVTSITDPKGISTYYEYDTYNRLKFVKDKGLNILQKYCYNYKGEFVNCSDNTSTSVVIYKSIARSGSFTRNNCAAGGVGSSVIFSQAVGAQTSTISQADADSKGLTLFNTNGQFKANTSGTCTFSSIARSGLFTKNNCAAGGTGSSVAFSQIAGAQTSTISQADADSKGLTLFNTNGQANANSSGTCTFKSVARSGSFSRNNCSAGSVGSSVAFSQAAGVQTSIISQADADSKGLTLFNTNGQANANVNGTCLFSSIAKSGAFTRNNCTGGAVGSAMTYIVPAGKYTSATSQAVADALAQTDLTNNGQAYANTNGTCILPQIEFSYEYFFNVSTRSLVIDVMASGSGHNGATLNFNINYIRNGQAATRDETVIFPANWGDQTTTITFPLGTTSIVSVDLVQLIRN